MTSSSCWNVIRYDLLRDSSPHLITVLSIWTSSYEHFGQSSSAYGEWTSTVTDISSQITDALGVKTKGMYVVCNLCGIEVRLGNIKIINADTTHAVQIPLMEENNIFFLHSQNLVCWWSGYKRRLGSSKICSECTGFNTRRVNTLGPRQNGRHFPDDIFKCISLNEIVSILINIWLKFVPKVPINNISILVQTAPSHYLNQ